MPDPLFVVTRSPRSQWRAMYSPYFWFVHARSAAAAVRLARELLPDDFGRDLEGRFNAPHAERVVAGGSPRKI